MVEAGTLCGQTDVAKKAGANASATSVAEAYTNVFIKEAEGLLCTASRYDWVTNYASISTIGKEILRDAVASYSAVKVISYDMSGFTSRQEALIMINILWACWSETMRLLTKDNNYRDFILTGSGDVD
ncbi:MAG: hypothetical protein WC499_04325 [Patescibacteria group bacterium]